MSDIETQLPALLEAKMLAVSGKFKVMRRTNIDEWSVRALVDPIMAETC